MGENGLDSKVKKLMLIQPNGQFDHFQDRLGWLLGISVRMYCHPTGGSLSIPRKGYTEELGSY